MTKFDHIRKGSFVYTPETDNLEGLIGTAKWEVVSVDQEHWFASLKLIEANPPEALIAVDVGEIAEVPFQLIHPSITEALKSLNITFN